MVSSYQISLLASYRGACQVSCHLGLETKLILQPGAVEVVDGPFREGPVKDTIKLQWEIITGRHSLNCSVNTVKNLETQ